MNGATLTTPDAQTSLLLLFLSPAAPPPATAHLAESVTLRGDNALDAQVGPKSGNHCPSKPLHHLHLETNDIRGA